MDSLELHLKLDKMDPSLVPDSSVKHKNELYQKVIADWTEVESKGKQLIKDATDVRLLHEVGDRERVFTALKHSKETVSLYFKTIVCFDEGRSHFNIIESVIV